ncbi:hypothetical protein QQS21_000458 [Conoideocrella luteorostrata]|uniref:DUF7703 domain-containing protein n=1 Tax=Conoideocrella luteorostrata TaxID=1105319 RepID=A0AAJ0D199_9HYPO|nr:hypothetical protein QQS21_000458 [Conoideocrella luteorostrata]
MAKYDSEPFQQSVSNAITFFAVGCTFISLYNTIELNIITLSTFKNWKGLYFWSLLTAANGIALHSIGYALPNFFSVKNPAIFIPFVAVGWGSMVIGQSLVLFSRLHLLGHHFSRLKPLLAFIVINGAGFELVMIVFLAIGTSWQDKARWGPIIATFEKVEVTVFFLQEIGLSALYIKACFSIFNVNGVRGGTSQTMRQHLLWVNVFVVLISLTVLLLQYFDLFTLQIAYKSFAYSVKLKAEIWILSKLVDIYRPKSSGSNVSNSQ